LHSSVCISEQEDKNSSETTNNQTPLPGTLKLLYKKTVLDKYFSSFAPGTLVIGSLLSGVVASFCGMLLLTQCWTDFTKGVWWIILLFTLSLLAAVASLLIIFVHEQEPHEDKKSFRVIHLFF